MNLDNILKQIVCPPKMLFKNQQKIKLYGTLSETVLSFENTSLLVKFNKGEDELNNKCFVYVHSYGSNSEECSDIEHICNKEGMSFCSFDSRACGNSGGRNITFGYLECIDLLSVLIYLNIKHKVYEFILWSRSIGSCSVFQLIAYLDKNSTDVIKVMTKRICVNNQLVESPNFKIVSAVWDSPISDIPMAIESILAEKVFNFKPVLDLIVSFCNDWLKKNYQLDIYKNPNYELAKICSIPSLFIISENDSLISMSQFKMLIKSLGKKTSKKPDIKIMKIKNGHRETRDQFMLEKCISYLKSAEFDEDLALVVGDIYILNSKILENKNRKLKSNYNLYNHAFKNVPIVNKSTPDNSRDSLILSSHKFLANNPDVRLNDSKIYESSKNIPEVKNPNVVPIMSVRNLILPFNDTLSNVQKQMENRRSISSNEKNFQVYNSNVLEDKQEVFVHKSSNFINNIDNDKNLKLEPMFSKQLTGSGVGERIRFTSIDKASESHTRVVTGGQLSSRMADRNKVKIDYRQVSDTKQLLDRSKHRIFGPIPILKSPINLVHGRSQNK